MLEDGYIENNYVLNGNLKCDCGYSAKIEDGIIIFEGANDKRQLVQRPKPYDFEQMLPVEYVSAVKTSIQWNQNQILEQNMEGKVLFDYMT